MKQDEEREQSELLQAGLYDARSFVICNELGQPIEPRTMQDTFKRLLKAAKIRDANFHALRHTFATRAVESGMVVKTLSEILGHADVSTTLNRYAHSLPEQMQDANRKEELSRSLETQNALMDQITVLKAALHNASVTQKRQAKALKQVDRLNDMEKRIKAGIGCCRAFSFITCKRFLQKEFDDYYEILTQQQGARRGSASYSFPREAGIEVLTLEFLCFDNRAHAGAILAHFYTDDHRKVKLKVWPQRSFTPLCSTTSFWNNSLMDTGRRWLCAYEKMSGGWIELVCAIPAPDCFATPWDDELEAEEFILNTTEAQRQQLLKEIDVEFERNHIDEEDVEFNDVGDFYDYSNSDNQCTDNTRKKPLADIIAAAQRISGQANEG